MNELKSFPLKYEAIVAGISAGGYEVLMRFLPELDKDFPVPLIFVRHMHADSGNYLLTEFNNQCALTVKQADEKEKIKSGYVYFAPPNYHLMIEQDRTFSLAVFQPVNFARPSIDVLFESAAEVYAEKLIGIIFTGANNDGSLGLKAIKLRGGTAIVQDPNEAEIAMMPESAIETAEIDYIVSVEEIVPLLKRLIFSK